MEDAIKLCWFFYSAMVHKNSMRMNQTPETQVMKMNADNAIPLTPNPNVPSRHDSIFGRPNVGQPFVVVSPSPSTDKGADSSGTIPREKAAIPVPTEEPPSSPPVKVTFAPLTATYRYTPVQAHSEETNALDVTDLDVVNALDVTDLDVVFGRGGGTNRHRGNEIFRDLVAKARPGYLAARKKEKGEIARRIVKEIRSRGGRWLKKDTATGAWQEVSDDVATKKTTQAFREDLAFRKQWGLLSKSISGGDERVESRA